MPLDWVWGLRDSRSAGNVRSDELRLRLTLVHYGLSCGEWSAGMKIHTGYITNMELARSVSTPVRGRTIWQKVEDGPYFFIQQQMRWSVKVWWLPRRCRGRKLHPQQAHRGGAKHCGEGEWWTIRTRRHSQSHDKIALFKYCYQLFFLFINA